MRFFQDSLFPTWATLHSIPGLFSSSEPPRFDAREATIETVHEAIFTNPGTVTCRDVVSTFLSRIEAYNPAINAIISLDPDALSVANGLDALLDFNKNSDSSDGLDGPVPGLNISSLPPLFCIPILLKDSFDTVNLPTTGGCAALANARPVFDAPVVKKLRDAGAVILGKTNLHEMALEGLSVSSLGGQTVNPYDSSRTPGGSSGGTGAAVAASFAVLGLGTDTVNSVRSPASANSLFSLRPTRGLVSRVGVIPVSYTQDVVGPIARSVRDLAVCLNVINGVGYDAGDNMTALRPPEVLGFDYVSALGRNGERRRSLRGVRFGLVEGFFDRTDSSETTPVNDVVEEMVTRLKEAGADVVSINETIYNSTSLLASLDVQIYEYREGLDAYLKKTQQHEQQGNYNVSNTYDLYTTNNPFLVIPSQYPFIKSALSSSPSNTTYLARRLAIQNLIVSLRQTFATHNLDALIYPQQKNLPVKIGSPSQSGRNGILAALTGSPVVTVPAGFSKRTRGAPVGVPVGMEVLGLSWAEGKLLGIAARIEEMGPVRRGPVLKGNVRGDMLEAVPTIVPDMGRIPAAYPIGVLEG